MNQAMEILKVKKVFSYVYLSNCQGCRSLRHYTRSFGDEPTEVFECYHLTFPKEKLLECTCINCIVKMMCDPENKYNCSVFHDYVENLAGFPVGHARRI